LHFGLQRAVQLRRAGKVAALEAQPGCHAPVEPARLGPAGVACLTIIQQRLGLCQASLRALQLTGTAEPFTLVGRQRNQHCSPRPALLWPTARRSLGSAQAPQAYLEHSGDALVLTLAVGHEAQPVGQRPHRRQVIVQQRPIPGGQQVVYVGGGLGDGPLAAEEILPARDQQGLIVGGVALAHLVAALAGLGQVFLLQLLRAILAAQLVDGVVS